MAPGLTRGCPLLCRTVIRNVSIREACRNLSELKASACISSYLLKLLLISLVRSLSVSGSYSESIMVQNIWLAIGS